MNMLDPKFIERIATEVSVTPAQVATVIGLFESGSTIPFVARYRKDLTGNLDEVKLESISERHLYFSSLMQRRKSIVENIERQGRLTEELRAAINASMDKNTLEDIYLPFKKKRKTKASVAHEQGLDPLALYLMSQELGNQSIEEVAQTFVSAEKGVASPDAALQGARNIIAEEIAADAAARASIRERMLRDGKVRSVSTKNTDGKKTKFEAYYDFTEEVAKIPSHRLLAILRGVKEGFLRMELAVDDKAILNELLQRRIKDEASPFAPHIRAAVEDAYHRLIRPSIENEVVGVARQRADEDAIHVFRDNAKNLLLAAPAGRIRVIGLDPGHRTGCKLAVIDDTGSFLANATLFPETQAEDSEKVLLDLIERYEAYAIAIGNGTGSREASKFVSGVLQKLRGKIAFSVLVNEAGASVYSASKVAREEFPELDVTVRGAISIARRLQDPLAELVKLEPRSIGVGQYQHDVNQKLLREGLHRTVVSCVNLVGVDLNTASVPLLRYVSGIQYGTAQNIVAFRTQHGGFRNRQQLLEVDGIGPKVFEQCAGFMRINGGDNPLDGTSIHPEAYPVVEQMAAAAATPVWDLIGHSEALSKMDLNQFSSPTFGALALKDVCSELARPGRDPRRTFQVPKFVEGVHDVNHLEPGMEIEGIVTNVTNFGAFIDIGVHQDGLVHLSEMANRYVRDPREVVAVGEIVKVKVINVDKELPRISLSIKALQPAVQKKPRRRPANDSRRAEPASSTAPADGRERAPRERQRGRERPQERQGTPDRPGTPERAARVRGPQENGPQERTPQGDRSRRDSGSRERRASRDRVATVAADGTAPAASEVREATLANGRPPRDGHRKSGRDGGQGGKKGRGQAARARTAESGDTSAPLNTQLADQLAALREKFGG